MLGKRGLEPQAAFGHVLRELRKSAGVSQEALALDAGVDRNFVSLLETGQNQPTLTTLFKLAGALGKRPSELVAEIELRCSKD